jgi:hypothetical protein
MRWSASKSSLSSWASLAEAITMMVIEHIGDCQSDRGCRGSDAGADRIDAFIAGDVYRLFLTRPQRHTR